MTSVTGPLLLTDETLRSSVSATDAVAWMREAVLAADDGRLSAPPRLSAALSGGRLVFTTGELAGEWFGYRSYDTFDVDPGEQVVVLHAADSGRVRAVAVGNALGPMRTGALGGVAADVLAREDATSVGVVGSGTQAWAQLWAIASVRRLDRVTVQSRTAARARAFADRVGSELGLPCRVVGSAEAAVRDHDLVVLATTSRTPVLDAGWLAPGSHVTTVGPKQVGAAEFDLDLVDAAGVVVTDSLAQLDAYDPPGLVAAAGHAGRVVSLGAVASGRSPGRMSDAQVTLYLSVGLAGTELHLLARILERRER